MGTKVGDIFLALSLNSKSFNKELKGVKGIADNASNAISNSLKTMGKAVIAGFSIKAIIFRILSYICIIGVTIFVIYNCLDRITFIDYIKYILTRVECLMLFIGIILIYLSFKKRV